MNSIQSIIDRYHRILSHFHFERARHFGAKGSWPHRTTADNYPWFPNFLLVAEVNNYSKLVEKVQRMLALPEETWSEHFTAIAQQQWLQTQGTALAYFHRPRSLGYRFLLDIAQAIHPQLTAAQCADKMLRGPQWGVQTWVSFAVEFDARPSDSGKASSFHACLLEESFTGQEPWPVKQKQPWPIITDGVYALDLRVLLKSFYRHLPRQQRLVQRLLQEFLGALRLRYPGLYLAFTQYNLHLQALASQLDHQRTPRMELEQLRRVLLSQTELLTGNLFAGAISEQAVTVLNAYLESLTPPARQQLLALPGTTLSMRGIMQSISSGNCIDLISAHLQHVLRNPANTALLDSVLPRREHVVTAGQAWHELGLETLLVSGARSVNLPLHLVTSIITNLRCESYPFSGRLVSALYNVIDHRELFMFTQSLLRGMPPKVMAELFSEIELVKVHTILNVVDTWPQRNPISSLRAYVIWQQHFRSGWDVLRNAMPRTLQSMQFSLAEFLFNMHDLSAHALMRFVRDFETSLHARIFTVLRHPEAIEQRDVVLHPRVAFQMSAIFSMMPPETLAWFAPLYAEPAYHSGQLMQVWAHIEHPETLDRVMQAFLMPMAIQRELTRDVISFWRRARQALSASQQDVLIVLLERTSRSSLNRLLESKQNLDEFIDSLHTPNFYGLLELLEMLLLDHMKTADGFLKCAKNKSADSLGQMLLDDFEQPEGFMLVPAWQFQMLELLSPANALAVWRYLSQFEEVLDNVSLLIITRLHRLLPPADWQALVEHRLANFSPLLNFADVDASLEFCWQAYAFKQSVLSAVWKSLQTDVNSVEAFLQAMIMLEFVMGLNDFTARDVNYRHEGRGLFRANCFSKVVRRLTAAQRSNEVQQLFEQISRLVTSPQAFAQLADRMDQADLIELLNYRLNSLISSPLNPGDFSYLASRLPAEHCQQLWQHLMSTGSVISLDIHDLQCLAQALPIGELNELLTNLQGQITQLLDSTSSLCQLLKYLPQERQALVLKWAKDYIKRLSLLPEDREDLLALLAPDLRAMWREELMFVELAPGVIRLFSPVPRQHDETSADSRPPRP